jgi:hypothetical protein
MSVPPQLPPQALQRRMQGQNPQMRTSKIAVRQRLPTLVMTFAIPWRWGT